MKTTKLEAQLLRNVACNLYQPGNGSAPNSYEECADVWSDCLNELPRGMEPIAPSALPGVVSSLTKKGLLVSSGSTIRLTRAGFDAYKLQK